MFNSKPKMAPVAALDAFRKSLDDAIAAATEGHANRAVMIIWNRERLNSAGIRR